MLCINLNKWITPGSLFTAKTGHIILKGNNLTGELTKQSKQKITVNTESISSLFNLLKSWYFLNPDTTL